MGPSHAQRQNTVRFLTRTSLGLYTKPGIGTLVARASFRRSPRLPRGGLRLASDTEHEGRGSATRHGGSGYGTDP